jgi:DNA adenine methylase
MLATVAEILRMNKLELHNYAEPYAGGCGLALALLIGGHVSHIHINDVDDLIWSFWHSVLHDTSSLIEKTLETNVTMDQWHQQKDIIAHPEKHDHLELGFAAFFLNRTNRSGIIKKAGTIGGKNQSGKYKIDCRFNKNDLIKRIERIAKYKNRISLYKEDALTFLDNAPQYLPKSTFLCIDPPYYNKGASLYTSFYEGSDHKDLRDTVLKLNYPWIITYDNVPEVRGLYSMQRNIEFGLQYSLQEKKTGQEVLIPSKGLRLPRQLKQGSLLKNVA